MNIHSPHSHMLFHTAMPITIAALPGGFVCAIYAWHDVLPKPDTSNKLCVLPAGLLSHA